METPTRTSLRDAGQEALGVALGFGILGFQRVQVMRREWERSRGEGDGSNCANHAFETIQQLLAVAVRPGRR